MFPTSWLMQSALSTPSCASRSPAPTPAWNSVWPTCVSAPNSSLTSLPVFMETIGMPASFAFSIDSLSASGSGMEMTSPSGSEATAASMSWLIFTGSKVWGALYSTSTPMSAAPWSTPFLTTDQNGSEAWPWVTTAILMSPRSAPPPPCASPPSWPPAQPAATSAIAATRASQTLIFALPLTISSSPWGPREPTSLRRLDHLREILKAPAHVLLRPRAGTAAEHDVLLQDVPALVAGRIEQLQYPPHVHVPLAERPVEPAPHGLFVTDFARENPPREPPVHVLEVHVAHPLRRLPGELDGVPAADHRVPRVEAQRGLAPIQEAPHVLGALDHRTVVRVEHDAQPMSRADPLHRRQRREKLL